VAFWAADFTASQYALLPSLVDMFKAAPFCANSICNLHFFPFQFCGSASFAFIAALIARACEPHSSRSSQLPEPQLPSAVALWHPEGCNGAQPIARLAINASIDILIAIRFALTPCSLIRLISSYTLRYCSVITGAFSTTRNGNDVVAITWSLTPY